MMDCRHLLLGDIEAIRKAVRLQRQAPGFIILSKSFGFMPGNQVEDVQDAGYNQYH